MEPEHLVLEKEIPFFRFHVKLSGCISSPRFSLFLLEEKRWGSKAMSICWSKLLVSLVWVLSIWHVGELSWLYCTHLTQSLVTSTVIVITRLFLGKSQGAC